MGKTSNKTNSSKRVSKEDRWAHFGPYYAMFPLPFAQRVIKKYSQESDIVLDPFAGRFTSVYAAAKAGRNGYGIEINPVGWLYGLAKLKPAPKDDVINRLCQIYAVRNRFSRKAASMPEFYHICFCDDVLKFLLSARKNLKWKDNNVDATLMAFLLVYLHGKKGQALSNQMQGTKSMGMDYSITWWKKNNMQIPPRVNPVEFMTSRIEWRYKKGKSIENDESHAILGDSVKELDSIVDELHKNEEKISLLFTSPPYFGLTDYFADQWLRMWLLGGKEVLEYSKEKYKRRFSNHLDYRNLLDKVFEKCSKIMSDQAVVYVRTDARNFTLQTTIEILKKHFPDYTFSQRRSKLKNKSNSQTILYGNKSSKPIEVDIILRREL